MISYPMTNKPIDKTIKFELKLIQTDIKSAYQKTLKKASLNISIKGFRKWKAPLDLVEKEISSQKVFEQIVQDLLPPLYDQYIKTNKNAGDATFTNP